MSTVERIRAKVTRAKQHIQDFQLGLRAFYDTKPYHVAFKEDANRGQRIYCLERVEPVPDSLTAIAADIIQNLRDPLDHIAYQLVLDARGGTEPEWTVYYPISGSAAHYPATRNGKIKGVRQEVVDAIDATEPYKGGKGHALWQLNELNKPGKHQLLVGAGSFYSSLDVTPILRSDFADMWRGMGKSDQYIDDLIAIFPPFHLRPADRLFALHIGDELYTEPIDRKVTEHPNFTFDVSLDAPSIIEPEPALKTFQDLANLVDNIISTLGQLLP